MKKKNYRTTIRYGLAFGMILMLLASAVNVSAAAEGTSAESSSAGEETALFGSPWVDSIVTGNIPDEAPDAADDLFLHYNYDDILARQGQFYSELTANTNLISNEVSSALAAGTVKASEGGACTDAEIEQLNIFYQQAADLETLQEEGISRIQPYLDMVAGAETLEELNNVLVSEDFPFSPFLYMPVNAYDMSGVNNVFIYPEFLFVDNLDGSIYYQETDDPIVRQANQQVISTKAVSILADLSMVSESQEDAMTKVQEILYFEQSYGKDAGSLAVYQDKGYGSFAAALENLSLDELAALAPNYPVKETVEKFGKSASPFYSVLSKKWLETFNAMWTEENLESIKLAVEAKILHECEPYIDTRIGDAGRAMSGLQPFDAQSNAASVINQPETFAQLVAEIFITDHYTDEDISCLTELTNDLISTFKTLIGETDWLSDDSRDNMLLKLDNMRMNIVVPEGGYIDFSGLSLTPTAEGGSLVENYLKLKAYIREKINERIGQPALGRAAWEHFPPSMVNCFYDQDSNSVNIFPGFLSAGMYWSDMSEEELFGGIGWVIGHEISHGFDFSGSQYDAYGAPNSIFDDETLNDYLAIVDRMAGYYDTIEPLPEVYVSGNTVKGEAAADLIGLQLVLDAAEEAGGLDNEAIFRRTADIYCQVLPSGEYIPMLIGDVHPLNYLRTNINAQMFDEFYETFGVQEGDGMYLPEEQRIQFWG